MLRNIRFSNDNGSFPFHIDFFPTSQEFYHDFMTIKNSAESSSRTGWPLRNINFLNGNRSLNSVYIYFFPPSHTRLD